VLLAVALVGAVGTTWLQYNRLGQAEQILGKYWSNDFADVFSSFGVVDQELRRIVTDGEVGDETGVRLDRALSAMTPHLTNTLGDTRGYLPNVPQVPYLLGYLDQVRESVNVHRGLTAPRALTPEERQEFQEYADFATELTSILREHYPRYPGNGPGFGGDDNYWASGFLSDTRWRQLLLQMDGKAQEAGFMAR
jgi:hypothetical protein